MPSNITLLMPDDLQARIDRWVEYLRRVRPESRTSRHSACLGLLARAVEAVEAERVEAEQQTAAAKG